MIVDEVHAVAATKRGAHLALSLERLDALLEKPAQRIGLSATVRPVEEVSAFLAGSRPVRVVQPASAKTIEVSVQVPVPDMSALGELIEGADGPTEHRASIWPAVEQRVLELVRAHRSTIVFANSRRLAERLTSRLNELAAEEPPAPGDRMPAELMGQAGRAGGAPGDRQGAPRLDGTRAANPGRGGAEVRPAAVRGRHLVPRAGHRHGRGGPGRAGRGAADGGVGLQRIGRAGHQVGAVSRAWFSRSSAATWSRAR